jgi:hypothetical protein
MPHPPTPGQICYEAYWQGVPLRWTEEPASEQAQWEAAAQAVLEAFVSSAQPLAHWGAPHVTDDTPCFCGTREEDGVVIHRRMPWERPGQREGEA